MQLSDNLKKPALDLSCSGSKYRILVGVTGSVAALKLPLLVSKLLEIQGRKIAQEIKEISEVFRETGRFGQMSIMEVDVRVITTNSATHFYNIAEIPVRVYTDKDEWEMWTTRSDPVLHIELRRWANLLVIAPLDANTLGKIASGICDNLLTCVVRAWDTSCPLLFCPAMNTSMWQHPITAQQVATLQHFGYVEIPCIAKKLVCGDEGKGAMAEVSTIVDMVQQYLPKPNVSSHK